MKYEMNVLNAARGEREGPPGIKILAAYLALSLVPATISWASTRESGAIVLLHVFALIVVLMLAVGRQTGVVVDWLPLVAVPFLYAELPHVTVGHLHDDVVQRWELAMFGTSPAQSASGHWPNAVLSELLHAAYLSYYLIIYGPPIVLYTRGRIEEFRGTVAGLMTMFAICYVAFILFPVAGPRYEWAPPTTVFDGPVRRLVLRILAAGSSRGTAFPSSHVAVATVQTVLAFRRSGRTGLLLGALTSCLGIGAVYGGFHYGIDVLAGGVLGLAVGLALLCADRDVFAGPFLSVAARIQSLDESADDVK
jgi:membrane-associated phospholipid phosphatase